RINIEASAALATWNDLYREDPGGRLYTQLVDRAVYYLPMAEEDVEAQGHRVRGPRRPGGSGAGGPGNRRHSTRSGTRRRRASLEPRPCQRPREHGLAQRARGEYPRGWLPRIPARRAAGDTRRGARTDGLRQRTAGARD